ncbi:MAG: polyphenol oxidase family protein, partial [Alphaproteobacteria bacterium]
MLTLDLLDRLDGVAHGFFTRKGGVSTGIYAALNCGPGSDDDPAAVAENRSRALARLGGNATALVTANQVHGIEVVTVTRPWPSGAPPSADGLVTRGRGIALGVLSADCAPVLLADADAEIIGVAHAGWKGALAGIVEATVAAMAANGAHRVRIRAAIGPCIAQASYEVGAEFAATFAEADPASPAYFIPGAGDRRMFDLPGYVAARLRRAGIG